MVGKLKYSFVLVFTIANALEYLFIKASGIGFLLTGMVMFGVSGLLLLLFIAVTWNKRPDHYVFPLGRTIIIGLVSFLINMTWLWGMEFTTAANASVLGKTDVAFSLLFSWLLLNEGISKKTLLYIAVMLTGIFFVMNIRIGDFRTLNIGDMLVIISAALLAFNAFQVRKILKNSASLEIAAANCFINMICFLIAYQIFGDRQTAALADTVPAIFAGVFCFLFFCGYYPSLRLFPLWKVRSLALLIPVFTILGEVVFLNVQISTSQIAGALLVLIGVGGIILMERERISLSDV